MAVTEYLIWHSQGASATLWYDDVILDITSVDLVNYSGKELYVQANKLDPPAREFSQSLESGNEETFDIPAGFHLDLVPQYDETETEIVGYTVPNITTYVRLG